MRPLITALILLAACTDSNPNIHEPPAMTAGPSQAPDQTEQPNGKTLLRQAQQQYTNTKPLILPTKPRRRAKPCRRIWPSWQKTTNPTPPATPQYFDLLPQDLAAVTRQAEQGSRKAKAEYWQKRAQEAQAK